MKNLQRAKKQILKSRNIIVACHINPDGDTIGSLLSLGLGLESLGKKVFMLSQDGIPQRYHSLPSAHRIKRTLDPQLRKPGMIDLAISVDCSTKELLGFVYSYFHESKFVLDIDHHEFRRPFGDFSLIDEKAAAVGEIVHVLLNALQIPITPDIAQNILTSIIVETNSFRLPTVRPTTFDLCSKLIKRGIDFYQLAEMVYWTQTKEATVLMGLCLSRCQFSNQGKIAWSIVREVDFYKHKAKDEHVDSVASDMLAIKGVEIAVFFREKSKKILRVSLRSKGHINIAQVAEVFQGGGHFDVAGCVLPNTKKSIKALLSETQKLLE